MLAGFNMKTFKQFTQELNEKVRIRFKGHDGAEDELSAKDYVKMKAGNLSVPTAYGGALVGGAVGGLPGAAIGAGVGWLAGEKIQKHKFPGADDSTKIQWKKTIKANWNPKKHAIYKDGNF